MYDQYIPGNVLGFNYWDGCYFTGTSTSTTKIGVSMKGCFWLRLFLEKLSHACCNDQKDRDTWTRQGFTHGTLPISFVMRRELHCRCPLSLPRAPQPVP